MSENLDPAGLVSRFGGGASRGVCYQINGLTPIPDAGRYENIAQLTTDEAETASRLILLDIAKRGGLSILGAENFCKRLMKAVQPKRKAVRS